MPPSRTFANFGSIVSGRLQEGSGQGCYYGQPETTGTPMPLAGEIIAVLHDGTEFPRIYVGSPKLIHTQTSVRAFLDSPYLMSPACLEVVTYSSDLSLPPLFVFRNADQCGGARLLEAFEGIFSRQVLSAESVKVHCGAITTGAACDDRYSKIWPRGMGLDYSRTHRVAWLLQVLLKLVAASEHGKKLQGAHGKGDVDDTSKMCNQVLYYPALAAGRGTESNTGGDMHPHLDGPFTGWVAIATIGGSADFCVDDDRRCHRFFDRGVCPATNVKQAKDMRRWKAQVCHPLKLLLLRLPAFV